MREHMDTPEDEREAAMARIEAYATWQDGRGGSLGDLDLRAAAQHAQAIGDSATARRIDSELSSRGSV